MNQKGNPIRIDTSADGVCAKPYALPPIPDFVESRTYRITGITPILGTQPASEEVRTKFVAAKAPSIELEEEERELFEERDQTCGLTVFPRDPDAGDCIIVLDYMVRGFFKAALGALTKQLNVKNSKSKVDKYLFVSPRRIPLMRDGEPIYDEDDEYERPLRCETMRGPRVALQGSERINDPWSAEFTVMLVPNAGSKASESLDWERVESALNYGQFSGLGQFRNGSFGRFTWERVA